MKDNILLLVHSITSQWGRYILDEGYHIYQVLKEESLIRRVKRKIDLQSKYDSFNPCWLGDWINYIQNYDTVIIFAHPLYKKIISYIRKIAPGIRIIIWYMDPYESCHLITNKNDNVEEYSFDIEDCKKYGFSYSNTFYCIKDYANVVSDNLVDNDIFFIGLDKGRYNYIDSIRASLMNRGFSCDINIVKDRWTSISLLEHIKRTGRTYSGMLNYDEVIQHIKNSRALLDINQNKQTGISQRPLEALFYNKKLITTNQSIQDTDFYNANNIYIISGADLKGIEEFMKAPFCEVPISIKKKYTFEGWINQF